MLIDVVKLPFRVARRIARRFLRGSARRPAPHPTVPATTPPAESAPAPIAAPQPPTSKNAESKDDATTAPIPPEPAAKPTKTKKGTEGKAARKASKGKAAEAQPSEPAPVGVRAEPTPNPNAMKFTCAAKVVPKGSLSFNNKTVAAQHPIGAALFEIPGVKTVFAVNDFVTVTKEEPFAWDDLAPKVERTLAEVLAKIAFAP